MTGFNSKQRMAADKLQEPVAFDAFLTSQDFDELMQTYRHCLTDAFAPFEDVKFALRAAHIKAIFAQPAQERNFCPRCGKRTADLTVIHTCTPPQVGQ